MNEDMNQVQFEQINTQFAEMRADMNGRFDKVDERFSTIDARFSEVDRELSAVKSSVGELKREMGDLKRETGDLKGAVRRTAVVVSQIKGAVFDIKCDMATKDDLTRLRSHLETRMDSFASEVEAAREERLPKE
ncbi:MAG: hypothetical protein HY077_10650 [Elusimicrobia bacterium]|nr:hypothetical protein [Elusimicrobiota bacterium]